MLRQSQSKADITLWVSADSHAKMYRGNLHGLSPLQRFQADTGQTVRLDLMAPAALDVRLLSMFMFAEPEPSSPDLVEIDIGSIGKFFRPPIGEVGFLPLNHYLESSGWQQRITTTRFAPWTKDGTIFGVPNDLHPCTLTYRKDLFDQAGVDLESASTWPVLQQRCLAFQRYWAGRGRPRVALGLSTITPDMLLVMLHQQRIDLVDAALSVHLTDAKVLQTLCWYAEAVAGRQQIAADLNPAPGENARDLASGDICGLITPDWMIADLKQFGVDLAGKLHMLPLPRFADDDARTASWGGTMIGITRTCADPNSAWKLIDRLYLDRATMNDRHVSTGILPPIPEYWSDPIYHQPDSFYANQKIDEAYIQLAGELPPMLMTAYTTQAQTFLSIALNRAVEHVRLHGSNGLERACRGWLADASAHVSSTIQFANGGSMKP